MKIQKNVAFFLVMGLAMTPCRAGLIHRYSFDQPGVKDSVGNVDATLKGSAKISDGKLILENTGKTSGDDGVSYLQFNSSVLPATGSVSFLIWLTEKENPQYVRIIDFGDKSGAEGQAFIYLTSRHDSDQTKAAITASDTGSKTEIDGKRLDDGKPHMAAVVIDGAAKKLHLFIDGQEAGDAVDLGDNTLDKVNPTHCWIGRSGFDADPGLSASIEEFRVYDNALTPVEISEIYNAGAGSVARPTK